MVIVDSTRCVVGGVDTHRDVNVGAVVDMNDGRLGVESFPTNADGHRCPSSWMPGFGRIERVGIEGTGAYGAGVARHFVAAGVVVKIMTIDQANVSLNVLRDTGSGCRTVIPKSDPSAEFVDAGPVAWRVIRSSPGCLQGRVGTRRHGAQDDQCRRGARRTTSALK